MNIKNIIYDYLSLFFIFLACISAEDNNSRVLSIPEIYSYGHKYTAWFYSYELDSLSERMVDKKYTIQNLSDFRQKVDSQIGQEINVLNERAGRARSKFNQYFYVRYSRFAKFEQPVKTEFSFDSNDHIYQFSVETLPQEAPTHFLSYKTKTRLRLPFHGLWYVAAGGRAINTNHHAVATDQRFAYDFLIKKDGYSFQNDGSRNEDDFCYNQEIIAPGSGTIVAAVNNIPENRPGEMSQAAGNYIIIDHGNGEFSILAHLKQGSIAVKPGDKVAIGKFLGRCGNSGHAAQAHLHYHLQNSPVIFKGEGLPAQFQSYLADGKEIAQGEPVWDQYVMNK
jgi:hypothetical protein